MRLEKHKTVTYGAQTQRTESYAQFMASRFHVAQPAGEASGFIGKGQRFQIARVTSAAPMKEPTSRFRTVDSLIVSVSLCDIPYRLYEFWTEDKARDVPRLSPFTVSLTDLKTKPVSFVHTPFDYLHYDLPRKGVDEVAGDLGIGHVSHFRCFLAEQDLFIAQLSRLVLRDAFSDTGCDELEMDRLGLLLAAHLLQNYAGLIRIPARRRSGLAPWQKKRVTEFLHANLHREVHLAEVAATCSISPSHFARSFRLSFGMPITRWVSQTKLQLAKDLLKQAQHSLETVASLCGFAGQSTFTRWFTKGAGTSPGEWRRNHQK
jgi:AraC family transcriptional regulator